MRISISLATVSLGALALAACGGPPESANEEVTEVAVDDTVTEAVVPDDVAADAETTSEDAAEVEVDEPAASETATPAPTPSASASTPARPAAAATQVAAAAAPAGPPDSFTICTVCHSVTPGQNMVGPSLAGVFGRKAGAVSGFAYSAGMKGTNITWNEANLRRYLVDPHAVVPGGSMPAPGINAQQAGEITAYLKTL